MDFKQYPNYKDSGVEWLGEVPEHWQVSSIKHLSSIRTGNKDSIHVEDDGKYPFFLRSKKIEKINSYSFDGEAVLTAGDGDVGEIVHYINGKFDFHQRVYMMSNFKKVQGRFFYYYFYSLFKKVAKDGRAKTTVDSLRKSHFDNFFMTIPELQEQNKIVSFLDSETSRIDNLIAKQEKLIEKLEEHRKSVISHAVTKGLDPNVPMRDSGSEWLGEVPETWKVTYLKYQTKKITSGKTPLGGATVYTDSGVTFLRSQNIYNDGLHLEDVSYIPDHIHQDMKGSEVYTNDILLNITGASIGRTCLVESEIGTANVNQHVCIIRPKYVYHAKWISMFLKANAAQSQISFYQNGAGREGLNFSQIGNIRLPLPSMEEQCQILESIEAKSLKIEKLISKQKELIAKLKEYRTSIISHAVTGKIDVRDLVA